VAHKSFGVPILLGFDEGSRVDGNAPIDTRAIKAQRLVVVGARPQDVLPILDKRGLELCRPLFTGGVDLLRWAISGLRTEGQTVDLDYYGLGRMNNHLLSWWFERVRRLGLPAPDAVGRILEATGGIPLLVRNFDAALRDKNLGTDGSPDEEVSPEDFQSALERCQDVLPELARRLRAGEPSERLHPREREILAMAARVCLQEGESCSAQTLRYGLSEGWIDYYQGDGLASAPPVDGDADEDALALLQGLGFLPFDANLPASHPLERLDRLGPRDPLWGLVALMTHGESA